jgi:hypothetical protein
LAFFRAESGVFRLTDLVGPLLHLAAGGEEDEQDQSRVCGSAVAELTQNEGDDVVARAGRNDAVRRVEREIGGCG